MFCLFMHKNLPYDLGKKVLTLGQPWNQELISYLYWLMIFLQNQLYLPNFADDKTSNTRSIIS